LKEKKPIKGTRTSNDTTGSDIVERRVMCRWWQAHKYNKWEDLSREMNMRNQPILIQERRCMICNSAQRQTILMD